MKRKAVVGLGRLLILAGCLVAAAPPLEAQSARSQPATSTQLNSELARLRQASVLESEGNVAGAESLVRGVLQTNPTSLSALLTLERLLAAQGRGQELIGPVDRLLEQDPGSVVGHQTRLRVQLQLKNSHGMAAAANAWIRAMPKVETPYRETALAWRQQGEPQRAIEVLELGRKRIDRADALALELGDAYLAVSDPIRAAAEWTRAVGSDGRGLMLVQRRLQNLPDGGARLLPLLVDQLATGQRTSGRLRAAALLAIDAGMGPRAERLANDFVATLGATERAPALLELARRADGGGLHRIAYWAYGEMVRGGRESQGSLAIQSRLAELALLSGDTARAALVYEELETAAAVGSPQRRQALALRIQLMAREGDLERAGAELPRLRGEFPGAAELDPTAAEIALRHLAAGNTESAEKVLAGIDGPRAAQLRGRIALGRGELERAREELMSAAPLLRGSEATETIALAALILRLSPAAGELLAKIVSAAGEEREGQLRAAALVTQTLPARDRAPILDFLAGSAERDGLAEDADDFRQELVTKYPTAQEAPAALLALARSALSRPDAEQQARVLLEKVIVDYPRSALVPQARRELERLHGRSSS